MTQSPQEPGSHFADVVNVPALLEETPKLRDHGLLSVLHKKFWGKSMADEEQEWRSSLPPTPTMDGDTDDLMQDDGDEGLDETGMNDDIAQAPGCYVLDLGHPFPKLWIRPEYILIYDYLDDYYRKPSHLRRAPAAVITGQPGVGEFQAFLLRSPPTSSFPTGKSTWMLYALRRRLGEMKPVIWYFQEQCHLFVNEGVFVIKRDFGLSNFKTIMWTLVDSDQARDGVPSLLVSHFTPLYVIYTTSPCRERWSRLHKTVRQITIIMSSWTRKEILHA